MLDFKLLDFHIANFSVGTSAGPVLVKKNIIEVKVSGVKLTFNSSSEYFTVAEHISDRIFRGFL
jgi:hypothetical protein